MFQPPISISLSPNTQNNDYLQAVKTFFQPWKWKKGMEIHEVEKWFNGYFQIGGSVSFNSGRSAFFALLKTFGIGKGDEVIIQAYTCVAVVDPIIWVGATPIYVDIDRSLNIDSAILEQSITVKTKAIVVQHTFGIPSDIQKIKKIAQKYHILLIEDCAHSLGATIGNQKIGTFGDGAFFSFGRDKIVSSVFGGMAFISSKFKVKSSKLKEYQNKLPYPNSLWIIQQLLHPLAFGLILPLYNYKLGKIILFILQKIKLLSFPIEKIEKEGSKPHQYPAKFPNALAQLLLMQLGKIEKYNSHRRKVAALYFDKLEKFPKIQLPEENNGAVYLRFNILTKDADKLIISAKKKRVLLGTWYKNIIDPKDVNLDKIGYKTGMCPKAEEISRLSVNLPTYPRLNLNNIESIIDILK